MTPVEKTMLSMALKETYGDWPFQKVKSRFYHKPQLIKLYCRRYRVIKYEQLMDLVDYQGRGRNNPKPWAVRPRRKKVQLKGHFKKTPLSTKPKRIRLDPERKKKKVKQRSTRKTWF